MTETKERVLNAAEKITKEFVEGVTTNGELCAQLYDCVANKSCTVQEFTDELLFLFSVKQDEVLEDAHNALTKISPFYDGELDDDDCDCDECICDDCKKEKLN